MTLGESIESAGGSEYKGRYREHDLKQARVALCKPEAVPVTVDAPMETCTTNKRDFTEHPVQKQGPMKPSDNNLRAEGDLDFNSSYSLTFQGRTGERARPIKYDKQREQLEKFVGEPTYTAEFRPWNLQPRERREAEQWKPPSGKMDSKTTNQSDFHEMAPSQRTTLQPVEEIPRSDDPFMGETGYRETFKEHRLEPKAPRYREAWKPPSVKFSHETTKQTDFKGPYQPKRESCRPDRAAFNSNAPFHASTTNRADFQEKPLGQRYVHRQKDYVEPEGAMDLTTTNHSQFREFPVDSTRRTFDKPGSSNILRGTGPMVQTSGYTADFTRPKASPRRELMKPKANYEPSKEKFDGESTAKRDYGTKQLSPRETYRPTWEPVQSDAPFASNTENRESFVEQPLPPRRHRGQEVYMAPSVPFNATTTNKDSYQGEFAPKRGSFKPTQTAVTSDAKFEANTTFNDSYKKHDVSLRHRHQHEEYVQPEGAMDMLTSNQENFRDFGRVRRHVITKPGSSHVLRGEGKIANSSSYTGDFSAPPPQARHLAQAKREYKPSEEPFNHVPTYQSSFTGAFVPKQPSFRPANRPLQNLNAFEDNPRSTNPLWQDVGHQVPPVSV